MQISPTHDANDVLYSLKSSTDYDPALCLGSIKAKVFALNFSDDEFNPEELHILERLPRLRHSRYVVQPGLQVVLWPSDYGAPRALGPSRCRVHARTRSDLLYRGKLRTLRSAISTAERGSSDRARHPIVALAFRIGGAVEYLALTASRRFGSSVEIAASTTGLIWIRRLLSVVVQFALPALGPAKGAAIGADEILRVFSVPY